MAMRISVIIPTLDEERTIMALLAHTVSLGFDELIVVDGGSLDQTPVLVESYRRNTQLPAPNTVRLMTVPCGRARQMNEGATASSGEILLFLHADTQLPEDAKATIETALTDHRKVGGRFDVRFDSPSMWGTIISRMVNWPFRPRMISSISLVSVGFMPAVGSSRNSTRGLSDKARAISRRRRFA